MAIGRAHYTGKAFAWYCLIAGMFTAGYAMTVSAMDIHNAPDVLLHLDVMRLPFMLACIALGYALHLLTASTSGLAAALGFASLVGAQAAALWIPSAPWIAHGNTPTPQLADAAGAIVCATLLAAVPRLRDRSKPLKRPSLLAATLGALVAGSVALLALRYAEQLFSAGDYGRPDHDAINAIAIAWMGAATTLTLRNTRMDRSGVAAGNVCYLLFMFCALCLWPFIESAPYFLTSTYRVLELCALGAIPFGFCLDALLALRRTQLHSETEQDPAQRDPLTGLFNRRALETLGASIFEDCLSNGRPASLLMMDLDHFKRVNDLYGHPAGDQVLRQFADILRASVRATDLVARYGGEEFVAILPGSALGPAVQLGERIRVSAETTECRLSNTETRQTVSIGAVTAFPGEAGDFRAMLERADRNLYRAKREGRNRICTSALDESEETN
jgi:diguanylate cyclase (GGDEF)-like protein